MSRVDDLITQHCPDGVDFKPLGALCEVLNGYAFKSELFNSDGVGLPLIRIRDVNTRFSSTFYSGDYDTRYRVGDGDILIGMDGDFTAVRWAHGTALLNQRVCRLHSFTDTMLSGFMFYKVQDELNRIQSATEGSTVKHLSSRELERARIPVPPREVQGEIVRILDRFTGLEAELEAELNAELEARRRQYADYREALLAFSEAGRAARWLTLSEIGTFKRGANIQKSDFRPSGLGCIHYGQIHTRFGPWTNEVVSHVDAAVAAKSSIAQPGNLIIATTSEDDGGVAKAVAWMGTSQIAVSTDALIYQHSLEPKYVAYFFQTDQFQRQVRRHITGTKVRRISGEALGRIWIPIPPLTEQRRIVEILDRFDALVNDLSIGLPAELAARRKQYEHYRERLLTFKEAA